MKGNEKTTVLVFSTLTTLIESYTRLVTERIELLQLKDAHPDFNPPQLDALIAYELDTIRMLLTELESVRETLDKRRDQVTRGNIYLL